MSALVVLFLHAFLSVPHLQPLEHFTKAFLKGQPVFLTAFLRLQEFLQEQVCDENKLFAMESGCWWWNNLHFFNIYVHSYIVIHFHHFAGNHLGSLALSERVRLGPEWKQQQRGARYYSWEGPLMQGEKRMKVWILEGALQPLNKTVLILSSSSICCCRGSRK